MTKNIGVQIHFVRKVVEKGSVYMHKIHTKDNIADVMTKLVNVEKFEWCRSSNPSRNVSSGKVARLKECAKMKDM